MSSPCYHCGEAIPKGLSLFVTIFSKERAMCCIGCQAISQTIVDNNLTDYYQYRTEPATQGAIHAIEQIEKNKLLDDETIQEEFTYCTDEYKEAILTIDGISCAACAWLIERQLNQLEGLITINVNATTQRATIRWQDDAINLSEIISAIDSIGYHALPFKASSQEERNQKHAKQFIKRLGISGILMMQVMMIAFGLYFGAFSDMAYHNLVYLRWASMILTIPVVTYGAFPFYSGAIKALKAKRLSMDVPVSIAISLAFSASMWATISQQGEVYFESVSMFTFLLLIGKFLEFRARARAAEVSANLLKLMPMSAIRVVDDHEEFVAARKLKPQDIIKIKPGDTIPADGIIIEGKSQLNEAMLSGEQKPVNKSVGDNTLAGTVNGDGNLTVEVKNANNHTFLSQLIRLSESSQSHKPKLAKLSDKIAQYFIAVVLSVALATAVFWSINAPDEAFWITLSVLVATCPCALSLATPTALTCATTKLNKNGIMIKSPYVMETIPQITMVAFDKTGTLTNGDFSIERIDILDVNLQDNVNEAHLLAIAAALESYSAHPIAKAFLCYRDHQLTASQVNVEPGAGVSGTINNNFYQIGKASWLLDENHGESYLTSQCVLLCNQQLIAAFYLKDSVRADAKTLINTLSSDAINTMVLSGDNKQGCQPIIDQLSIKHCHSSLSADDKVNYLKTAQNNGETVAMIGDGVNDTPVFGAAHISIAMGSGTDIAKNGADVILLNNQLQSISLLKQVAAKTKRIIWQNYLWAFGYNAIILPLAVCGFVTPYIAVIGMSTSSILVVTNSLRLLKK